MAISFNESCLVFARVGSAVRKCVHTKFVAKFNCLYLERNNSLKKFTISIGKNNTPGRYERFGAL